MNKKIPLLLFRILCFSFFFLILDTQYIIPDAYAHILKTDGSIGAVLHIDPEDDPIAGQQAGFFLEFKDRLGRFKPGNCDCKAVILAKGREIYSQPLIDQSSENGDSATFTFTFPSKGEYQLKIDGSPREAGKSLGGGSFAPFELGYDIDVDREVQTGPLDRIKSVASYSHFGHYVAAAIVLVFFIFALIKQRLDGGKNESE